MPVNKTRTQYSRNNVPVRKSGGSHYKNPRDYGSIQSQEELDAIYNEYMDSFTNNDYELITACKMTMILPSEYYGNGSYDKWIRVYWALKNTSLDLLVCWLKFSSQSSSFRYPNSIMECIEKWDETEIQSNGGLTIGVRFVIGQRQVILANTRKFKINLFTRRLISQLIMRCRIVI